MNYVTQYIQEATQILTLADQTTIEPTSDSLLQPRAAFCRDRCRPPQVAAAFLFTPVVNPPTSTPHTESFQAMIWRRVVSPPKLNGAELTRVCLRVPAPGWRSPSLLPGHFALLQFFPLPV